jgi:Ca2+-binding RTX toxin-like protein
MLRALTIFAVLTIFALVPPGLANASTASVGAAVYFTGADAVRYLADPGETNDVTITSVSGGLRITDLGATISAGSGCTPVDVHEVTCSSSIDELLEVELGDQDDVLTLTALYGNEGAYFGGDGNDRIRGGEMFIEYLFGEAGDDRLRGRGEADILDGGTGADTLSGGTSGFTHANAFNPHIDRVTYDHSTSAVRVSPNGVADDGEIGEGDNVLGDIEIIVGGSGGDVLQSGGDAYDLIGGLGDDVLKGGPGFQSLAGGPGNDLLYGRDGRDFLTGGAGDDTLRGGAGLDDLRGWAGNDRLIGGLGRDRLSGGGDDDVLLARDGHRDVVRGGLGNDRARIDSGLDDVRGVETLVP